VSMSMHASASLHPLLSINPIPTQLLPLNRPQRSNLPTFQVELLLSLVPRQHFVTPIRFSCKSRNVSFVAVRVTSPSRDGFRVAAFGKIPVTFSHGAQPSSPEQVISLTEHEESSWSSSSSTNTLLLRAIPDPQAASDAISAPWHKESSWSSSDSAGSLFELVSEHKRLGDSVLVVLEAQRGYLREHLSDPLQALMRTIGWDFCLMPPSEKLHRLGVTSDKASVVRCAIEHFPPNTALHVFLGNGPVEQVHDVADAALFAIMVMESKL